MRDKLTIDDSTVASNPSNTKVNPLVWFRHKPIISGILALMFVLSVIGVFTYDKTFSGFVIITLVFNYLYWKRITEHFNYGDSNGGLVVGIHPTLVAVSTNLTKGFGSYPVVKIIKCPSINNVAVGDEIATSALYDGTFEHLPYWNNFNPVPLVYATSNLQTLDAAMASYPNRQWQQLKNGLAQIETPYQQGLYQIHDENSDWDTDDVIGQ